MKREEQTQNERRETRKTHSFGARKQIWRLTHKKGGVKLYQYTKNKKIEMSKGGGKKPTRTERPALHAV